MGLFYKSRQGQTKNIARKVQIFNLKMCFANSEIKQRKKVNDFIDYLILYLLINLPYY